MPLISGADVYMSAFELQEDILIFTVTHVSQKRLNYVKIYC